MRKVILIYFLFFSQNTLFSDESAVETSFLDRFIPLHDNIVTRYHHFLKRVDDALCANEDLNNTKLEKIIYKNNIQIITSLKYEKDKSLIPYLYIRANIILPKTSKRFEFTIDKQTNSKLLNQKIDTKDNAALTNQRIHFGLKYNLVQNNYFNFYAKLGTKINEIEDIYAKVGVIKYLNFRYFMLFWDANLYRYIFDEKLIASTSLNLIKPLNETFLFEKDIILTYKRAEKSTELDFIAKLYHTVNDKSSYEYWLSYTAEDNDIYNYAPKKYALHIRYRYMLKKWAYIELIPQLLQERDNHFKTQKAIALNFGLIFSK